MAPDSGQDRIELTPEQREEAINAYAEQMGKQPGELTDEELATATGAGIGDVVGGAVTGGLAGFAATGGPWGAVAGGIAGGAMGADGGD